MPDADPEPKSPAPRLAPWLVPLSLFVFLAAAALAVTRTHPPAPLAQDAPTDRFSADRAFETLSKVLLAGVAHPTGSAENDQVRERIVAELRDLGYAPELQAAVSCSRFGSCGNVSNIIARAGRPGGRAVLVMAHYDSVPAGPGVSDDGMGVAVLLEVARALAMTPALPGPVLFLFTDGEEAGLLGANAFVRSHPAAREVGTVINVEARGSRGPSLMFETSDQSSWLVRAYASAARRPVTSSLFYAVYRRMPNDTDLTVFKRAGYTGLNLANVGGIEHYHTSEDELGNLSKATLQHHGETTLALVRRLAAAPELTEPPRSEAVFFDVLGWFVISWPLRFTRVLVGIAVLTWFVALFFGIRSRTVRARPFVSAFVRWPATITLATLISYGAFSFLRARGALPTPWPAYFGFGVLVEWAAVLVAFGIVLSFGARRDAWAEWGAGYTWWAFLSVGSLWVLPEAAFLGLVVLAVAGLTGILAFVTSLRGRHGTALLAPLVAAALLWMPVIALSRDSLGFALAAAATAAGALSVTPLLPVLVDTELGARRTLLVSAVVVFLVAMVGAWISPAYSESSPQRMSFALHEDADAKTARWLVDASGGPIPKVVLRAGGFDPALVDPSPWFGGWGPEALAGPAEDPKLPAPEWTVLSDGSEGGARHIRARARSLRDARMLTLHFPPGFVPREIRVAGELVSPRDRGSSSVVAYTGPSSTGILIEMVVTGPGHALLADHSFELPESGTKLIDARPGWAVRSQFGDTTVVSRRIDW